LLRDYVGMHFGNIRIEERAIHTKADGKRFLILHGDEFDSVVKCSRLLAMIGTVLYDWLLRLNRWVNYLRRHMGLTYWSLAGFLKHQVKEAVQYISNFEHAVAYEARRAGVDGVICGHIHRAEITRIDEIEYCNCGDWVESCTALVEHFDGRLEIVHWTEHRETVATTAARAAAA
jgi:UDP-2,3-diacylglucosamine pyrophosphatase LpxH